MGGNSSALLGGPSLSAAAPAPDAVLEMGGGDAQRQRPQALEPMGLEETGNTCKLSLDLSIHMHTPKINEWRKPSFDLSLGQASKILSKKERVFIGAYSAE